MVMELDSWVCDVADVERCGRMATRLPRDARRCTEACDKVVADMELSLGGWCECSDFKSRWLGIGVLGLQSFGAVELRLSEIEAGLVEETMTRQAGGAGASVLGANKPECDTSLTTSEAVSRN